MGRAGEALHVRDLTARAVNIPLNRPIQTAGGSIGASPLVLIDLLTEEGITGRAYVFCYTPIALAPLTRLVINLAEPLRGVDARPATLGGELEQRFRLLGFQGLVGMAMAGIDMAAWDAEGKASGRSLSRLLGSAVDAIPAYAGIRSMDPREAAQEAVEAVRAGFSAVKIKVGHPDVAQDVAVIRAVRAAVGDGVQIMVDYNQSLTVPEAVRRGQVLDAEGVAWIEEPVRADDDDGHALVRQHLRTPIQLGENWWGVHDMEMSIAAGASQYVTLDAVRIGGVSGWLQAGTAAEAAGLPVSSHRYPELSASLLAATPTAHWLEYVDTVSPVLAHPVGVEGGRVLVPQATGSGLDWDEDAVCRYLV